MRKVDSIGLKFAIPIALFGWFLSDPALAQPVDEIQIKAVFIYNFTQFIEWPDDAFEAPDDPFVIGVLGQNLFGKYLEEAIAGEHYKTRPIVVKYFATAREIDNCQVLYVGSLPNPTRTVGQRAILTVGERDDYMEQGGLLRFYKEKNKLRIEINEQAAKNVRLVISAKLLQAATIYYRK